MSRADVEKAIDSQCLSYWLDALTIVEKPNDELSSEKIALVRVWFYTEGTFSATETVIDECLNIKDPIHREQHKSFIHSLLLEPRITDRIKIDDRVNELSHYHSGVADCRILAEAEEIGLDVLLTYDTKFIDKLAQLSSSVRVRRPSEYWDELAIDRDTNPITVPHPTNPLSNESWWRW